MENTHNEQERHKDREGNMQDKIIGNIPERLEEGYTIREIPFTIRVGIKKFKKYVLTSLVSVDIIMVSSIDFM